MIVLDTNVVSELTRMSPSPAVLSWFNSQNQTDLYITVITVTELCFGVALLPDQPTRDRVSRQNETILTSDFAGQILNLDEAAARVYAEMLAYQRINRVTVEVHDNLIAAIARSNGASVATRNLRDFRRCGIPIINPWETGGTA
jgi:predicted nucleic acid-binding protein